jgi:hypothetical protein
VPIPSLDLRRHPRFELLVQVEVRRGDELVILPARNLSLGGIYLNSDGNDLSAFAAGSLVELLLFDAADESRPPLAARAQVVRRDSDGVALKWREDAEVARRVGELIETIQPARRP